MAAVDAALQQLSGNKAAWASASLTERITVLKEIRARLLDQVVPWSRATAGVRCTSRDTAVAGDVLATGTYVGVYVVLPACVGRWAVGIWKLKSRCKGPL